MSNPRLEKPVDTLVCDPDETDDTDAEDYDSDVYELRTCYRCDCFLPLDEPARLVGQTRATAKPVCDCCYELYH